MPRPRDLKTMMYLRERKVLVMFGISVNEEIIRQSRKTSWNPSTKDLVDFILRVMGNQGHVLKWRENW